MKKKVDYRSTGKQHEDKIPWTSLVAAEVARIKKSDISPDSLYYKNTFVDYATSNCGFRQPIISDEERIGSHEEWLEGYRYFCRQKVNTKGKKVDRRQLKDYNYNNSKFKI